MGSTATSRGSRRGRGRRLGVCLIAVAQAVTVAGPLSFGGLASAASVVANDDSGTGFTTPEDVAFVTPNVLANDVGIADVPSTSVEVFYTDFNGTHAPVVTGSTNVSAAIAPNLGFQARGSGSSTAGDRGVGGSLELSVYETDTFNRSRIAGGVQASAVWDDVRVSGPSSTATFSASTFLDGVVTVTKGDPAAGAVATVRTSVSVTATPPGGGTQSQTVILGPPGENITTTTPFAQVVQTAPFTIDTSQPVTVRVDMWVAGTVGNVGFADILADLEATLGVPGGDVFAVPTGFTVDSASAGVVGNQFSSTAGDLHVESFDTTGTSGLVSHNGDGTFSYDPNGAFDALVDGETATDTFTYTATDGFGNTDTATVTITITGQGVTPIAADLAMTIEYPAGPYLVGQPLVVTTTVTNNGPHDVDAVAIRNGLGGSDHTVNSITPTGGTCIPTSLSCPIGALAVGETTTIVYDITPNQPGTFTFAARPNFDGTDTNPDNDVAAHDFPIETVATDLAMTIEYPAGPYLVGQPLVVTTTVTNNGPHDVDAVAIRNGLGGSDHTVNSITPTGGTCIPTSLSCPIGALAVGETTTIVYDITPNQPGTFTFAARPNFDGTDTNPDNDVAAHDFPIETVATDLAMTIEYPAGPYLVGQPLVVTTTVTNNGPHDVDAVAIRNGLGGSDHTVSSITPTGGTCIPTSLSCPIGALAVGETTTIVYDITPNEPGTFTFTTRPNFDGRDLNPTNDVAAHDFPIETVAADLAMTIEYPAGPYLVGQPLVVTTTVTNNGPHDVAAVAIRNGLGGSDHTVNSITPTGGTCIPTSLSCPIGALAVGETTTIVYDITPNQPGTFTFTTRPNFDGRDLNPANDVAAHDFPIDGNRPPVAVDDNYSTAFDTALSLGSAKGVLANDGDPDGDGIIVVRTSRVTNGTLDINPDGSFTFTPTAGFAGGAGFSYVISDGLAESEPASVAITVNDPPTSDLVLSGEFVDELVIDGPIEDRTAEVKLQVTNTGPDLARDVAVVFSSGSNGRLTVLTSSITQGECPSYYCVIGDLGPGASVTIVHQVAAADDAEPGPARITFDVRTSNDDPNGNNNYASFDYTARRMTSDLVLSGEFVDELVIDGPIEDRTAEVKLQVTNTGPDLARDVAVVFSSGSNGRLTVLTSSITQGECPSYYCVIGDLGPGASVTIVHQVAAADDAEPGPARITFDVRTSNDDPNGNNNYASFDYTAPPPPPPPHPPNMEQ